MSLWVDKHRPRYLENVDYHIELSQRLKSLTTSDFPHILVYGPSGAGKKTRVVATLKELFGPAVEKIKIDSRVFTTPSNKKLEFTIVSSIYHMEITPSDMGSFDRVVIQDLLKEVAQTQQVDLQAKQKFKVVVINEADSLTRDAQAALRRTMEKYSPNLRLILLANTTSNIIAPIKSRTLLIRVAAPTNDEISTVLAAVSKRERVPLPSNEADYQTVFNNIAFASNRNLRKALLILEAMYAQNGSLNTSTPIPPPDWEIVITKLAADIASDRSVRRIVQARAILYELISHCIPPNIILKTLSFSLLTNVQPLVKPDIIDLAATYDHRLRLGSKSIYHLEAFVAKVMTAIEKKS
ncbi:replication factor C subunit 5 [Nadsonia fulvescens var. elongata DSM 6958]|uniref:Replication factor C subunit 5 n=1 Tax=Nadsonia fulvescens var. elongata DSM 6958 TaxID=857566 RepID=A0A1E3PDT3_9ASCO|nr:replication factor C subunit 5 [Nadsonia fulvescens var. elongata DSM 6958]